MKSFHAPSERSPGKQISADYLLLSENGYLNKLLNVLPYAFTILNKHRQIVYSNQSMLDRLGISDIQSVLGLRTGEALQCLHSTDLSSGCGTSKNCQVCAAVNTLLKSQDTGKFTRDECRIRSVAEGEEICLDLEVTVSPFKWMDSEYSIFTFRDISNEKRKEALERIFFHDLSNSAGTLQGIVEVLRKDNSEDKKEQFLDLLEDLSLELSELIRNQRDLMEAEKGELEVNIKEVRITDLLKYVTEEYGRHEIARAKNIVFKDPGCDIRINSDPVLIRRILGNMIKNSLEASDANDTVSISCSNSQDLVRICVHNSSFMEDEIQYQIFHRSFSTKGKGRGLGTYSMKLLGEKYLGGKIGFSSSRETGTEFFFEIPARQDQASIASRTASVISML